MKKLLALLFIILIGLLVSPYVFISNNTEIAKVTFLNANKTVAFRCLTQENLLQQFLKDSQITYYNDSAFVFKHNNITFHIKKRMFEIVEVLISDNNVNLNSYISFLQLSPDSTGVEWKAQMKMSNNPLKRVQQYLQANKIHKSMSFVFDQLKQFVSNKKNVYGLAIERTLLTDSLLVTTKTVTNNYPSQDVYYDLIKKLQDYLAANGASPANYPMLNIAEIDTNKFVTTVAVPINKVLPDKGAIVFKRMFPGNILTTEVKGGAHALEQGIKQLNLYMSDNQLSSPAIPFQSLITNRLVNRDTSKWMTKLYYPIY